MGGDFNAKVGTKKDFLPEVDEICEWSVLDSTTNKHGEALVDFLHSTRTCILNGRVQGIDDFTYVSTKGRSVVDYFKTHIDSVKYCKEMNVFCVKEILDKIKCIPTCAIPDHSILELTLDVSDFRNLTELDKDASKSNLENYAKKYRVDNISVEFMRSNKVREEVFKYDRQISSTQPTQQAVNELYQLFINIHTKEMDRILPKIKQGPPRSKKHGPWNKNLEMLFKETVQAEKKYCKYKSDDDTRRKFRLDFTNKQAKFDKAYRKEKFSHMRKKEVEIESMVGKNGKYMWKSLDKIGPQVGKKHQLIPEQIEVDGIIETNIYKVLEKWASEFGNLYAEKSSNLIHNVSTDGASYDGNGFISDEIRLCLLYELEGEIQWKEVVEMVKQLKKNKAASVDLLPNEVLKNDTSIDMLTSLFNFCFVSHIIPDLWTKSLIKPVYKGGNKDRREPLNYRPISLM